MLQIKVGIMRQATILAALTLSIGIAAPGQMITKPQGNRGGPPPTAPQLVDPGFEAFIPAPAPIYCWYSDELTCKGNARLGLVTMTKE